MGEMTIEEALKLPGDTKISVMMDQGGVIREVLLPEETQHVYTMTVDELAKTIGV